MTGERLAWHRLASHLQIPTRELQDRITYSEFLDWCLFLDQEEERQTKQDFYLAQVAAEVRRGYVKSPKTVKVSDFLLQRVQAEEPAKAEPKKSMSKQIWAKALNVKIGEK